MKTYAIHFNTYSKTKNLLRSNQVVLVQTNTLTPFAGYLQRYIDKQLTGEYCLINSILDTTTDAIYTRRIQELSKNMLFKTPIIIQHAAPGKPILINNEPPDA